jgi:hypothetical protein
MSRGQGRAVRRCRRAGRDGGTEGDEEGVEYASFLDKSAREAEQGKTSCGMGWEADHGAQDLAGCGTLIMTGSRGLGP